MIRGVSIDPGYGRGKTHALAVWEGDECVELDWWDPDRDYGRFDWLAIEVPRIYPGSRVKPSTIVQLAYTAGFAAGSIGATEIYEVKPQVWTRGISKSMRHKRLLKQYPELEGQGPDALDAFGLGLYIIPRIKR